MNNSLLSFRPVFSATIVFAVALLVFLFFVYKELQRKQKFLALRIAALSLLMISLMGLLLRPFYHQEKKYEAIVLLTKGYQSGKVDSIAQKNPELKILRTKDAAPYSNSSILKSWYDLREEKISVVVGQGLPNHALELLRHKTFQFIPSALPKGITKLIIPKNIYVNTQDQIQGTFNDAEKTKIKLIGPGGAEDSITLGSGEASFSLTFTPKQSGKFIYSLVTENDNASSERLPIEVLRERQLRILFIQKFPTAEVRFLKNFLEEKNHKVILRYQTSKGNFSYEYSNTTRVKIDGLHSNLLNSLDLLIVDQKSYVELSSFEKKELRKSIRAGLGIIFLLNDTKEKTLNEFVHIKARSDSKDTAHLHLSHDYALPVLPIERQNDASMISVTKNNNRVLSGYFFSGQGKIGLQFTQETYRLGMAGNPDDYSSLWVTLIGNTARTEESNFKLKLATPFPYYLNEPIDIAVGSSGLMPSLSSDSVGISLKENTSVEDYWTGRSWADKSGWHQLRIEQDSSQLNYFVSDTSEWKSLRITNQMKQNSFFQHGSSSENKIEMQSIPASKLIFYLVFLFSSAFLWLAPKI